MLFFVRLLHFLISLVPQLNPESTKTAQPTSYQQPPKTQHSRNAQQPNTQLYPQTKTTKDQQVDQPQVKQKQSFHQQLFQQQYKYLLKLIYLFFMFVLHELSSIEISMFILVGLICIILGIVVICNLVSLLIVGISLTVGWGLFAFILLFWVGAYIYMREQEEEQRNSRNNSGKEFMKLTKVRMSDTRPLNQPINEEQGQGLSGRSGQILICNKCSYQGSMNKQYKMGCVSWSWLCCLLLTTLVLSPVVCCVQSCKDTIVYCPMCGEHIHRQFARCL